MIQIVVCTIIYIICFAALLWTTGNRKSRYALAKGVTSLAFVATSLLLYISGKGERHLVFAVLFAALILCAIGDIMLGIANLSEKVSPKPFFAGFIFFSLAHVVFCVAFHILGGYSWINIIYAMVSVAIVVICELSGKVKLKKMKIPAYIYAFFVGLTTVKAVQTATAAVLPGAGGWVMAAGALLFLVSDFILMFLYFGVKKHKGFRYLNLSTYYIGIYLIAVSVYWY